MNKADSNLTSYAFLLYTCLYCFQSVHCTKQHWDLGQLGTAACVSFSFCNFKRCFWIKCLIVTSRCSYCVPLCCMFPALFDMSLMLLWACMLSSHFSPQNVSTETLRTVPGSRQCGATPAEQATARKYLIDWLLIDINWLVLISDILLLHGLFHSTPFVNIILLFRDTVMPWQTAQTGLVWSKCTARWWLQFTTRENVRLTRVCSLEFIPYPSGLERGV